METHTTKVNEQCRACGHLLIEARDKKKRGTYNCREFSEALNTLFGTNTSHRHSPNSLLLWQVVDRHLRITCCQQLHLKLQQSLLLKVSIQYRYVKNRSERQQLSLNFRNAHRWPPKNVATSTYLIQLAPSVVSQNNLEWKLSQGWELGKLACKRRGLLRVTSFQKP